MVAYGARWTSKDRVNYGLPPTASVKWNRNEKQWERRGALDREIFHHNRQDADHGWCRGACRWTPVPRLRRQRVSSQHARWVVSKNLKAQHKEQSSSRTDCERGSNRSKCDDARRDLLVVASRCCTLGGVPVFEGATWSANQISKNRNVRSGIQRPITSLWK